ncbi:MAG: AgmX/PglI C-terminal domain-containing protein [Deltaproteobacteria bacterium]|nr:AgmX/PglI C-terminal domain-containing protein [Deltaproteobacteria bacterium]MCW5805177.1 AgmX/PglI C-terminal domain-containing protein [Deltaproteobacteria bacterium]
MITRLDFTTATTVLLAALACGACGAGVGDAQKRLRTAVEAKQDAFDDCYEKTLARNAEAQGKLQVVLKVSTKGAVVSRPTGGKLDGKLVKCVQSTLDSVRLSPAPKVNMEVSYTLAFTPEG